MRRQIRDDPQTKWKQSTVANHCVELEQRLDDHWSRLTNHQWTIQSEERAILIAYTRLSALQLTITKVVKRLLAGDEWVTAEEHARIHRQFSEAMQERENLLKTIKAARERIQCAANDAQRHAGHAIGIERALVHLRQELVSLSPCTHLEHTAFTNVH